MKRKAKPVNWLDVLARVALLGCVTWLLNLNPRPLALHQALLGYTRAVEVGAPGLAAANLEQAAVYLPWRKDFDAAAARYRLQAGDLPGATALFNQTELQAWFTGADWMDLGDANRAAGNLNQAETLWLKGLKTGGAPLVLYDRLYKLYQEQGDYPAAAEALRMTLTLQSNEPARAYQLGLYMAALQPSAALVYLEQAAREPALTRLAGDLQRTIRTAELKDEPAYVNVQAGRKLASMGEWALAQEAFRQATLARPDYAEAWALLGEARQQAGGDFEQALVDLEQALALKPDSALVNSLLGLYWERRGDVDQMGEYLAAAAAAETENPVWQAEWGRALALGGDLDAARQRYEAAVELAPQDALYWRLLGAFTLEYKVDVEELGLPAARRALALEPEDAAALDLVGAAYLTLDNDALAERFIRRAIQVDPAYAPGWLHLGALYLYRGEMEWGRTMLLFAGQLATPGSTVADQAQRLEGYYFP